MKCKLKTLLTCSTVMLLSATSVLASDINVASETAVAYTKENAEINASGAIKSNDFVLFIDNRFVTLANGFVVYKDRTYLPMRELGEHTEAEVGWDNDNRVAIIEKGGTRVETPIGHNKGIITIGDTVNTTSIDESDSNVSTLLVDGSTYLPLRYISENLGYTVTYFADANEIHLNMGTTPPPSSLTGTQNASDLEVDY